MDNKYEYKKQERYVSVFRIERVPILPPLMTSEKRSEMLKYKQKAVEIERNLHQQRIAKTESFVNDEEDACLMLTNLIRPRSNIPAPVPSSQDRYALRRQYVEAGTSPAIEEKKPEERAIKLSKSETMIYDNKSNSVIMSLDDYNMSASPRIVEVGDCLSTTIPSISVNPPTPVMSKSLCEIFNESEKTESHMNPPQRSSTSPSLKPIELDFKSADSVPQLIRSNSFTLDGPSSVLLEHFRNRNLTNKSNEKPSLSTKHTIESRAKRVKKIEAKKIKPTNKRTEVKPKQSKSPSTTIPVFKNKRSPHELKSTVKGKSVRKHKTSSTSIATKAKRNPSSISLNGEDPRLQQIILDDIEERHREKFLELMRIQQEEQLQMQKLFEAQQKTLIDELTQSMKKVRTSEQTSPKSGIPTFESPSNRSPTEYSQSIPTSQFDSLTSPRSNITIQSLPSSLTSSESSTNVAIAMKHCTPRRLHFSRESSPTAGSPSSVRHRHDQENIRIAAATTINAYTRGYLTRRLFRTEQVQRIVQTIHDTLVFAINLHLDTKPGAVEPKENVILKARILQQLNSASGTLYFVFFQTTIKERMEIIAQDRKRLKNKTSKVKN